MSFTSYAQNFEDVMLWRALKHVRQGVYVDVGAQHPVIDSVSKAFYQRGWRGIHIEPVPEFAELLRKDRPDETVLQVALGATEGTLELNVIAATGLSTAVAAHARRHHEQQGMQVQRIEVPVLTLTSALQALSGKQVHWLKIDVEGFEEQVLSGWDSRILRPWVMVLEATVPGESTLDYQRWDPILVGADYQFVYFDGLNRFYIAREHGELAAAFACPPHLFDRFELSGMGSWNLCRAVEANGQAHAAQLTARLGEADARIAQSHAATLHWQGVAGQLTCALQAVHASTSWRITAPIRTVRNLTRALPLQLGRGALRRSRQAAKSLLVWAMRRTLASPGLSARALRALKRRPRLKQFLHRLAARSGVDQHVALGAPARARSVTLPGQLAPRAARIYGQLEKAREARKRSCAS
jgi:FkbM family methyltransferase